ncbi:MAG TPA: chemotaxis protein CheW [Myxococcota bacterium]|nr:chemotaxis protein CheW [Myxococcota bacterium]
MAGDGERLLTFEVGGAAYGLPIHDVLEVADVGRVACVPTLPRAVAGVVNHHGDALPVVSRALVFELDEAGLPAPQHLLVLGDRPADTGRVGLPVDRVLGLAHAPGLVPRGSELVAERRPIDGRVVHVLSTGRLLARVAEAIEHASPRGAH